MQQHRSSTRAKLAQSDFLHLDRVSENFTFNTRVCVYIFVGRYTGAKRLFKSYSEFFCWLINDDEPLVECGISSKVTPVDFCPPSVPPSVCPPCQALQQKAPGEQREQLVSLVWLKEKQRGNHFTTPARPIKAGVGLRGAGEALGARLHRPGSCRLSLPARFTPHGSRCCCDGERGSRLEGEEGKKKKKHEVVKGQ